MLGYILGLVFSGLVVGALGRLLHRGRDPIGIVGTILVGIAAELTVGLVFRDRLGALASFVLAVVVAALIVAAVMHFTRTRRTPLRRW